MINHVRNLLMNVSQAGYPPDFPGEEYIPQTFVPRQLPTALRLARQTLFGELPDRLYLNYRMRQLMILLHSTELAQYVYRFDPRITYLPFPNDDLFTDVFGLQITQLEGKDDRLYVRGEHKANEVQGQCEQLWDIIVTATDKVRVDKRRPPLASEEYIIDYTRGLSTPVPLKGSKLTVQWHQVPAGTRWQVHSRAQPTTDLGILLPQISSNLADQVFSPAAAEPVRTFETVWQQHELSPYRYSALLLAMAWRLNDLPQERR